MTGFTKYDFIFILLVFAFSLTLGLLFRHKDKFKDYTPDAGETAWFRTFGRECAPGLTKCKGADLQYYCSKKKNCQIDKFNLKGSPIEEPMSWFQRFV